MRKQRWVWVLSLAGLLLLAFLEAGAQDASVGSALRSMSGSASAVFVGQIVAIERKGDVVEVRFRVEQAIAGASAATYTLREWAGLWPSGMQRYHLGDRAMVFAQAASEAGLSTPVNGAEGVVPVVPGGSTGLLLDVARLETRVVRSPAAALSTAEPGIALADAVSLVRAPHAPVWREPKRLPLRRPGIVARPPVRVASMPVGFAMQPQIILGANDAR